MVTPDDPERTIVRRVPGSASASRPTAFGEHADALPVSTRLHEFEILSVIGQGGFGIVYLAHDLSLDRRVAIKEYMPSALATRTQAMTVAVRSQRHNETFAAGLHSFINEARLLARFDHPSLLKVHRFWEANGTAYMAMPYYAGITLARQLADHGGPPDEAQLIALLLPLLDALELMHAEHCFHRDIAPDNILLLPDGRPLLLDFGAARHVISDMTQAPTVILKAGYAPVEQYGAMPDMQQGSWTDLYALASVVEFAITGRTPPQAVARFLSDKREPLAVRAAGCYSEAFLRAIDRSLAVLPKDRPQSAAQLRALLVAALAAPAAPNPAPAPTEGAAAARATPSMPEQRGCDTADTTVPQHVAAASIRAVTSSQTVAMNAPAPTAAARPQRRATTLSVLASLLALAAAGAGYAWFTAHHHDVASGAASAEESPAPTPVAVLPTATTPTTTTPAAPAEPAPQQPADARTVSDAALPGATEPPVRKSASAGPAKTIRSTSTGPPRAAPVPARPAPHQIPGSNLPNARCADIIQRTTLGEELNDADKALLKQECRP